MVETSATDSPCCLIGDAGCHHPIKTSDDCKGSCHFVGDCYQKWYQKLLNWLLCAILPSWRQSFRSNCRDRGIGVALRGKGSGVLSGGGGGIRRVTGEIRHFLRRICTQPLRKLESCAAPIAGAGIGDDVGLCVRTARAWPQDQNMTVSLYVP